MKRNPFPITAYQGPDYFCNRLEETEKLSEALLNGRNTTLFSPRRMGKTGLIRHLFNSMKGEKYNTIYVDIFGTKDLNGFINRLANSALDAVTKKKDNFITKAIEFFGKIRPQISYNELSGMPQVSFTLHGEAEKRATLKEILEMLEGQKFSNFIAIDEFQQINRYPEKNTEQILRSHFQHLNNCCFIFSGSQRHMLTSMFSDPRRAFYQSSEFLALEKLNKNEYKEFIHRQFLKNGQKIDKGDIEFILEWTQIYTFYTQYLCNKIFSRGQVNISADLIKDCMLEIFSEREAVFYNYRNLLAYHQFRLLEAIGREEIVHEPTSQGFIKKYDLSNPSTVRKSLQALVDKEMIYEITGGEKTSYQVYDVFLLRWLQSGMSR